MEHVIYKLTSPSGKIYIGRTSDFDGRMASHKHRSIIGIDFTLYDAVRKYGWDNFIKEIIDTCINEEDAIYKELKHIVENDSVRSGYNSTYDTVGGGDHWTWRKDSDEYKEFIKKMSEIMIGDKNPMYGKTHTDEAKTKQKTKAKGRFSLLWFIEKYGKEIGNIKYNDRCTALSSRKMVRDSNGIFIKKVKS